MSAAKQVQGIDRREAIRRVTAMLGGVVFIGGSAERGQRIGVEFLTPAPRFWGVEFPPSDWPQKNSAASSAVN